MNAMSPTVTRLFDVLVELLDDHTGIIREVCEVRREAGQPDFFHFFARAMDTGAISGHRNFSQGGGASSDRRIAMAKAIGEAVERYASAIYKREDLTLSSYDEAVFPCINPSEFALHSPAQYTSQGFPYVPLRGTTAMRWAPGVDVLSDEIWFVPAAMVYMPYTFDEANGEPAITQRISTGLACHSSFSEAATSAACEVIERDAFTIAWQAKLAPPHIAIESLSDQNRDLVARFERTGATVDLLNITLDHGVPTVLAILCRNNGDSPALVFAASASLDSEVAVRKSLEELAHSGRLAHYLKFRTPPLAVQEGYANVMNQDDHVHLYCDHRSIPLASFIRSSERYISFDEIESLTTGDADRDLTILAKRIRQVGHTLIVANLTTSDLAPLGLFVVRAVVPGFHPLFIGHTVRALGGKRLWTIPQRLGYLGIRRESGDNPAPHPYP